MAKRLSRQEKVDKAIVDLINQIETLKLEAISMKSEKSSQ